MTFLALVAPTDTAQATDPSASVHLDWSAPRQCPQVQDVQRVVEGILDRPVFTAEAEADLRVRGRLRNDSGEWIAVLTLESADGSVVGRREVRRRARSCLTLDLAVPVVIALMIDLPGAQVEPELTPPTPRVIRFPEEEAPEEEPSRWEVIPNLAVSGTLGLLPKGTLGLAPGVEARLHPDWGFRLGFAVHYPRRGLASPGGVEGARLSALHGSLALCPRLLGDITSLHGCVGFTGGAIFGTGQGVLFPRSETRPYADASVDFVFRINLGGPFIGDLGLGLAVPLIRDRFFVTLEGTERVVHRPWAVIPRASLGIGVRLGQ